MVDLDLLINHAGFVAANEIHDYAAQFPKREDYLPLEKLAQQVQAAIVHECVRLTKEGGKAYGRSGSR